MKYENRKQKQLINDITFYMRNCDMSVWSTNFADILKGIPDGDGIIVDGVRYAKVGNEIWSTVKVDIKDIANEIRTIVISEMAQHLSLDDLDTIIYLKRADVSQEAMNAVLDSTNKQLSGLRKYWDLIVDDWNDAEQRNFMEERLKGSIDYAKDLMDFAVLPCPYYAFRCLEHNTSNEKVKEILESVYRGEDV